MKLDKMLKKLEGSQLLDKGDKIVLGFSGGPDSVFLLELLLNYKKKVDSSLEICLVHINHLLRGDDAFADEEFCRKKAEKEGLEFYIKRANITQIGIEQKKSFEEVGREVRYDFFQEVCKKFKGTKIALAHNKDDQIETFLFRMMRGSSLEGLEGIKEKRGIYIRPINEYYKEDILKYLDSNCIDYAVDKTNFENDYTRNSIRLDLIPFLEKKYNPKVKDKIFELINEIKMVNEYSKINLNKYLENGILLQSEFLKESEYIQRKIINAYLISNNLKSDRYKVQSMVKLINQPGNKKLSIEKNIFLKKQYNKIFIEKNEDKNYNEYCGEKRSEKSLKIPGILNFGNYEIEAFLCDYEELNLLKKDKNIFITNLKAENTVIVRNKRSGDKFFPTGMKNEKKLKDFFINEKISSELRDEIPIICFEDEIVWIGGVRGSEKFVLKKIKKDKIVILKLRRS